MRTITTTDDLAAFCVEAAKRPYVTVDTEFLRERTYYSKLCLIQLAYRDGNGEDAVLVDPLVDGLSLAPLYDLFQDAGCVKVFHAARQDLEIFFVDAGVIPAPLCRRGPDAGAALKSECFPSNGLCPIRVGSFA